MINTTLLLELLIAPAHVHYMDRMHSTKSLMRRWSIAVMCNILDLDPPMGLYSNTSDKSHPTGNGTSSQQGPALNITRKRRNCIARKCCKNNNKTIESCRKFCRRMCGRCLESNVASNVQLKANNTFISRLVFFLFKFDIRFKF